MAPKKKAAAKAKTADEAVGAEPIAKAGEADDAVKPSEEVKKEEAVEAEKKEEVKKEDSKAEADDATKEDSKAEADDAKKEDGEDAEMKEEAQPEEPVFKEEEDYVEDKRARVKAGTAILNMTTATPNVMASEDERLLMTLCDGGCQHLLAGVRSSIGVKAGRYMFEFKILEMLNFYDTGGGRRGAKQAENLIRVGFSVAGSDPLLVDGEGQVFFDSDGNFVHQKNKTKAARGGFQWGNNICVILNLDDTSPHKNTISLFRDGVRFCEPQALPEAFIGKALFPVITYKNVTLQVNWGPTPKKALPFKCRMLRDASTADLEVVSAAPPAKDGKNEILFPVAIPDQGVFDWLDQFMEDNPKYLEISDRRTLAWAARSGLSRPRGNASSVSNDKPGMSFGIPAMDDFSAQKALMAVLPALKRDCVCMELNWNLQASERARVLKRFPPSDFKRVAVVVMGDPTSDYKARIHKLMLAEKVESAELEKKRLEKEKEDNKWKEERDQSRKRKAEDEAPKEEKDEAKEGEEAKEEEGEDAAKEEEKKEEEEEEKPVELTDEEKALCFRKLASSDISPATLTKCFANYSIPAKTEGFDEIRYVWSKADECAAKFKEWLLENKRTQRIDDLQPSDWFKEKWATWEKTLAEWEQTQKDAKDPSKKKAAPEKKEEKKPEDGEDGKKEGDEESKVETSDKEDAEIDEYDIDVHTHEDINDIGNGQPLFANFAYEDWTLLSLRYEFHILVHAFRRDVNDPDRPSFHESHLMYYFEKYLGKSFDVKLLALENFEGLCALIKESVTLNEKTKFVDSVLPEDAPLDKFLRQAENHRRERQQCVDAGDESACLKFTKPAPKYGGGGRGYQGKSSGGGYGKDQQWDRNSSRGGASDRGGSSWGSSSYGDKNSSYSRPASGTQDKRYAESSSYPPSKYSKDDKGSSAGGSRGYDKGSSSGGSYGSDRRSYR